MDTDLDGMIKGEKEVQLEGILYLYYYLLFVKTILIENQCNNKEMQIYYDSFQFPTTWELKDNVSFLVSDIYMFGKVKKKRNCHSGQI